MMTISGNVFLGDPHTQQTLDGSQCDFIASFSAVGSAVFRKQQQQTIKITFCDWNFSRVKRI